MKRLKSNWSGYAKVITFLLLGSIGCCISFASIGSFGVIIIRVFVGFAAAAMVALIVDDLRTK